eukprot:COSAG05_NODE_13947_length_413_cov_0.808917_1_plen_40_part_01
MRLVYICTEGALLVAVWARFRSRVALAATAAAPSDFEMER